MMVNFNLYSTSCRIYLLKFIGTRSLSPLQRVHVGYSKYLVLIIITGKAGGTPPTLGEIIFGIMILLNVGVSLCPPFY